MKIDISPESVSEIVRQDLSVALADSAGLGDPELILALGRVLKHYTKHSEHDVIDQRVKDALVSLEIDGENADDQED